MKKKMLLIAVLTLASSMSFAQSGNGNVNGETPLLLATEKINPSETVGKPAKSPIQIPTIYYDGCVLTFDAAIEGCEVRLVDENECVIFSDFIEENQTSLMLPANLTGTYELQIIRGNIMFYCEIEL